MNREYSNILTIFCTIRKSRPSKIRQNFKRSTVTSSETHPQYNLLSMLKGNVLAKTVCCIPVGSMEVQFHLSSKKIHPQNNRFQSITSFSLINTA